jgi:cobalt/nickel transport system permease protein
VITGGAVSWFASTHPDGLEWALFHATGKEERAAPGQGLHSLLGELQKKTAFFPDYDFKKEEAQKESKEEPKQEAAESSPAGKWPAVNAGTSVAGIVGAGITMLVAGLIGFGVKRRQQNKS